MRLLANGSLVVVLALVLCLGCGPAGAAKKPAKKKPVTTTVAARPAPQAPTVDQSTYPSVAAAMADVEKVSKLDPSEANETLLRVETWLNMQGAKIAPDLEALIKDSSAGLASRLTACRVLARLGKVALPTLLEASGGEPLLLRRKAIESLGRVKPPSAEAVHKLVLLLGDSDNEIRRSALGALGHIGKPAQQYDAQIVEKLMAILNDVNEDETIRSMAKDALKKVDPRKGLMGVADGSN
jgi:HEAT repeat protein